MLGLLEVFSRESVLLQKDVTGAEVALLHAKLFHDQRLAVIVGDGSSIQDEVGDDPLKVVCRDPPIVWIDMDGREGDVVQSRVPDKVDPLQNNTR